MATTKAVTLDPVARRKRALILKLRSSVKAHRRFSIEDLGDGREKQTCMNCLKSVIYTHRTGPGGQSTYNAVVKRLIAYRAHGGGIHGVCPTCSKVKAMERYPMPEHLMLESERIGKIVVPLLKATPVPSLAALVGLCPCGEPAVAGHEWKGKPRCAACWTDAAIG